MKLDEIKNAIEKAIYIRDNKCDTLEEKDALATLINFADTIIEQTKED